MVHPLLPVPRLYRNLGVIPGLKGSIWFHDFWLAPPNKDIDKIGRPLMYG